MTEGSQSPEERPVDPSTGQNWNTGPAADGPSGDPYQAPFEQPAQPYEQQPQPYAEPQQPYGQPEQPYGQPPQQPYGQQPPGQAPYGQSAPEPGPYQQGPYAPGPPQGGYPYPQGPQPGPYQPGGYPPAGGPPVSPNDEKTWGTLSHVAMLITGFIGPLVIWAIYKDRSPQIRGNAAGALNFGILASIGMFVGGLLTMVFIGVLLMLAVWVLMIVFGIMGAMAANRGEVYKYPLNVDWVK